MNLILPEGNSLLMLAAYHVRTDAVSALLERGADHARVNDRGQTALGAATFRKSERIVRRLLAAGADPDLGRPSARELADFFFFFFFFELAEMAGLFPTGDRSTGGEHRAG